MEISIGRYVMIPGISTKHKVGCSLNKGRCRVILTLDPEEVAGIDIVVAVNHFNVILIVQLSPNLTRLFLNKMLQNLSPTLG